MPELPDDFGDQIRLVFGDRISNSVSKQADTATDIMENVGQSFNVHGKAVPVEASSNSPVIDLGSRNPNESWLMVPIVQADSNVLSDKLSSALRKPTDFDAGASVLLVHRFLDASLSAVTNSLVTTTCAGILFATEPDRSGRSEFALVDNKGVRPLQWKRQNLEAACAGLDRRAIDRTTLHDANLGMLLGHRNGNETLVKVREYRRINSQLALHDGTLGSLLHEHTVLSSAGRTTAGSFAEDQRLVGIDHGSYTYSGVVSYLDNPENLENEPGGEAKLALRS